MQKNEARNRRNWAEGREEHSISDIAQKMGKENMK
jgi:hypothetical protein